MARCYSVLVPDIGLSTHARYLECPVSRGREWTLILIIEFGPELFLNLARAGEIEQQVADLFVAKGLQHSLRHH